MKRCYRRRSARPAASPASSPASSRPSRSGTSRCTSPTSPAPSGRGRGFEQRYREHSVSVDLGMNAATGTPATSFNEREMQICTVARTVEDGKTYWVAGGGGPLYALLLAIRLYAPGAQYI